MDTQNELKEFFVNFFVPIDNIPEDTAWRNSIRWKHVLPC